MTDPTRTLGPKGLALVTHFEGLRLTAYPCSAAVWTIGWGTTRYPDGRAVRQGDTCTRAQADSWKRHDLARFESAARRLITVPLKQHEFDALVSFTYNAGEGALQSSTLRRHLNAGTPIVEARFTDWNKARDPKTGVLRVVDGLTRRRKAEWTLFAHDRLQFTF